MSIVMRCIADSAVHKIQENHPKSIPSQVPSPVHDHIAASVMDKFDAFLCHGETLPEPEFRNLHVKP